MDVTKVGFDHLQWDPDLLDRLRLWSTKLDHKVLPSHSKLYVKGKVAGSTPLSNTEEHSLAKSVFSYAVPRSHTVQRRMINCSIWQVIFNRDSRNYLAMMQQTIASGATYEVRRR